MASARILVIRGGAIGDFIVTLPVLAALRRQFPAAFLEILAYPHVAPLAVASGLAQQAHPIESRPMAGFFARAGSLDPGLADYFSRFAVILSYLYDPDSIFQENIGRVSSAQFIQGPHRPDAAGREPASVTLLKPLERLAIFNEDPVPRIELGTPGGAQNRIALHPGSGSEEKNWPEKNWEQLLGRLVAETRLDLLLVGGEAEGERIRRLASRLPAERLEVAFSLPLVALAEKLSGCRFFIGHDSGITHLAGALGVRGLALWGHSPEAVWRPLNPCLEIEKGSSGLPSLSSDRVWERLKSMGLC